MQRAGYLMCFYFLGLGACYPNAVITSVFRITNVSNRPESDNSSNPDRE